MVSAAVPGGRSDAQVPLVLDSGLRVAEADRVRVAERVEELHVGAMGLPGGVAGRQVDADADGRGRRRGPAHPVQVHRRQVVGGDDVLVGDGQARVRGDHGAGGVGWPRLQVEARRVAQEPFVVLEEAAGAAVQELVGDGRLGGLVDDEEAVARNGDIGLRGGRLQQSLNAVELAWPGLHAAGREERRRRLLRHQGLEADLGVLVADGAQVRDVVGDGTHGAALGLQPGHAGRQCTEQAHLLSPSIVGAPFGGPTRSLRRSGSRPPILLRPRSSPSP